MLPEFLKFHTAEGPNERAMFFSLGDREFTIGLRQEALGIRIMDVHIKVLAETSNPSIWGWGGWAQARGSQYPIWAWGLFDTHSREGVTYVDPSEFLSGEKGELFECQLKTFHPVEVKVPNTLEDLVAGPTQETDLFKAQPSGNPRIRFRNRENNDLDIELSHLVQQREAWFFRGTTSLPGDSRSQSIRGMWSPDDQCGFLCEPPFPFEALGHVEPPPSFFGVDWRL